MCKRRRERWFVHAAVCAPFFIPAGAFLSLLVTQVHCPHGCAVSSPPVEQVSKQVFSMQLLTSSFWMLAVWLSGPPMPWLGPALLKFRYLRSWRFVHIANILWNNPAKSAQRQKRKNRCWAGPFPMHKYNFPAVVLKIQSRRCFCVCAGKWKPSGN